MPTHVYRGVCREVSQVSRNQSGLLHCHSIPIHSNKTVKVYGSYSDEAVVTLLITSIYMFILIYLCLPEVDLEEDQSFPRPHNPPTSENLGIFC